MPLRKIVLNLCTSLDSFIEGSQGEIDWCLTDQDYGMSEFLDSIDTIFFGRISYDQLERELPGAFPQKERVIFSRSLQKSDGPLKIISENIVEEVEKILSRPGKNIWLFGGAELLNTLLNLNLVDEFIISIHPLLLGSGKPLFKDFGKRRRLKLKETKSYSSGLIQLSYEVLK